ncbi:MAG TPA: lipid-A-disaccharide synthase N-terminal domain-containing protein [Paracoccaceae bacterium]|nr:lipid-A-disaccharide synthase N-terminal domain-containing protein [Paracoccaceae bacterium]
MKLLQIGSGYELAWVIIGLAGQAMFMLRFLVQWVVSERARRSVIPVSFWYFSLAGAAVLLAYAIYRKDPVFILGQALGFIVYLRNLRLIRIEQRRRPEASDSV